MWEFLASAFKQVFDVPPDTALAYFFCMLAGVLVNWLWKCRREKIDPVEYWTANPKSTLFSFFGAVATFVTTMIIEPGLGKQTYFVMGIACDAMLNKPPLPISVQLALQRASDQFSNGEDIAALTEHKANGLVEENSTGTGTENPDGTAKVNA